MVGAQRDGQLSGWSLYVVQLRLSSMAWFYQLSQQPFSMVEPIHALEPILLQIQMPARKPWRKLRRLAPILHLQEQFACLSWALALPCCVIVMGESLFWFSGKLLASSLLCLWWLWIFLASLSTSTMPFLWWQLHVAFRLGDPWNALKHCGQ